MDIIDRIVELDNGTILNVMQAASEQQGTVEERLTKGYAEHA